LTKGTRELRKLDTELPKISVLDNKYEQMWCIMETLDIWKDVHPPEQVQAFINIIQNNLDAEQ